MIQKKEAISRAARTKKGISTPKSNLSTEIEQMNFIPINYYLAVECEE